MHQLQGHQQPGHHRQCQIPKREQEVGNDDRLVDQLFMARDVGLRRLYVDHGFSVCKR